MVRVDMSHSDIDEVMKQLSPFSKSGRKRSKRRNENILDGFQRTTPWWRRNTSKTETWIGSGRNT